MPDTISMSEALSLAGGMSRQVRAFARIEDVLGAAVQAENYKAELDKRSASLQGEVLDLEGRAAALRAQLEDARRQAAAKQAAALEEHRAAVAVIEAAANARVDKLNEQAEALEQRIALREREHEDRVADLKNQEAELSAVLTTLQSEVKSLHERIAGLSA